MKEIAIKRIKEQINYYKSDLRKYVYSDVKTARIEGTIFGLEQAIISVKNS